MEIKTTEEIAKLLATITVTAEDDGTFIVREDGAPFTRWPTQARADYSADHMRRFNDKELMAP